MEQIIVTSQAQFDEIPLDYNGRIIIKFGEPYNRAVINRRFKYPVEAWGNSSVVARGNSSVVAWDNSSVVAWDNSSVVARGNSSVTAKANSQVLDASLDNSITTSGNARIVHNPTDIQSYIEHHDIECVDGKVKLYKAVRKNEGKYVSDWDCDFEYKIGEVAVSDSFTTNPNEACGHGIHMAHKAWAVNYGRNWNNLAILELETDANGIIVPTNSDGKVRAASALVLREVPLEECGLLGKMLAKKAK